jgi:hypothetical protein
MAEPRWRVDFTRSAFYLDARNNPVNGYEVGITLIPYGDTYTVNVPDTKPATIAAVADELLENRIALDEMSG